MQSSFCLWLGPEWITLAMAKQLATKPNLEVASILRRPHPSHRLILHLYCVVASPLHPAPSSLIQNWLPAASRLRSRADGASSLSLLVAPWRFHPHLWWTKPCPQWAPLFPSVLYSWHDKFFICFYKNGSKIVVLCVKWNVISVGVINRNETTVGTLNGLPWLYTMVRIFFFLLFPFALHNLCFIYFLSVNCTCSACTFISRLFIRIQMIIYPINKQ